MNANENVNKYSLDELKVDSFVTTIPEAEQDMVRGGSGSLCWAVATYMAGKALDHYFDVTAERYRGAGGGDTNTDPGFFDTSYPCG